jgi:MarR family transcriptional regulator, organic hydroperoxide resistance regulator
MSSACYLIAHDLWLFADKGTGMNAKRSPPEGYEDILSLDGFLCFAVYSAGHAFNQLYRPLLDALGLTYPQYLVMVALWVRDDQTVKELGTKLFLESSTLTPLLKRLETNGHLTRSRDPDDERQVRVRLTKAGRALRNRAQAIPPCVQDALGLPSDAVARLQADLLGIRDRLLSAAAHAQTPRALSDVDS